MVTRGFSSALAFGFIPRLALAVVLLSVPASAASVVVPGSSNPWLAGMPDGTGSESGDVAPAQSPVQVTGVPIVPGGVLTFTASGAVAQADSPLVPFQPADGGSVTQHNAHAEHNIGDTHAPWNSLLGVFLGRDRPDLTPPPPALDFFTPASRNYLTLAPALKQVFFIGDGLNDTGVAQSVMVPQGATRLFLGTMDSVEWKNNVGSFAVQVVPEPSALASAAALVALLARRRLPARSGSK